MSDNAKKVVVDLTDSPEPAKLAMANNRSRPKRSEPIGVNMTFDIVDLSDEAPAENTTLKKSTASKPSTEKKPVVQTHPLKIIEASKKRKREREEARRRQEEARRQEEEDRRAEELRQKNLINGVNFIMIDDSSEEEASDDDIEEGISEPVDHAATAGVHGTVPAAAAPSTFSQKKQSARTTEWVYHSPVTSKKPRKAYVVRQQFSQAQEATFKFNTEYNYSMSNEDAAQLQERMFKEAAARLRARPPSPSRIIDPHALREPMLHIWQFLITEHSHASTIPTSPKKPIRLENFKALREHTTD
ncbi:hypothetical protein MPSEU_000714900 [Mayamaea pseudoterrestris]|nr:hypothetical protein MPSEU_000714900 [Mayamaea pseudoterrestris]